MKVLREIFTNTIIISRNINERRDRVPKLQCNVNRRMEVAFRLSIEAGKQFSFLLK
jgi:hypothetical protein